MSALNRAGVVVVLVTLVAMTTGCSADEPSTTTPVDRDRPVEAEGMTLASDAFEDGGAIAVRYANTGVQGGENVSLPLRWSGAPAGTMTYALVVVDRHPVADNWVHWMVVDIPVSTLEIAEGASGGAIPAGSRELRNTFGSVGYGGPQPPPGSGDHEYEVTMYALDVAELEIAEDATLDEFLSAVDGATLETGRISGFFGR
ncbi:MAG: YbhB/YbcL family Raf kinase inhibitor-like protein [Coriobacteriia bacterium]|nr:YbhB/YbcL family Raf kinase inhibitor-like protein [Coriobacteriia bacterium]